MSWHHLKTEYQKIPNWLGTKRNEVPGFITKKWIEFHDQSGSDEDKYKPSKEIRFKPSVLRSDLWEFTDVYIVVKGSITVAGGSSKSRKNIPLAWYKHDR